MAYSLLGLSASVSPWQQQPSFELRCLSVGPGNSLPALRFGTVFWLAGGRSLCWGSGKPPRKAFQQLLVGFLKTARAEMKKLPSIRSKSHGCASAAGGFLGGACGRRTHPPTLRGADRRLGRMSLLGCDRPRSSRCSERIPKGVP